MRPLRTGVMLDGMVDRWGRIQNTNKKQKQ